MLAPTVLLAGGMEVGIDSEGGVGRAGERRIVFEDNPLPAVGVPCAAFVSAETCSSGILDVFFLRLDAGS
jgi:hypothetical protein